MKLFFYFFILILLSINSIAYFGGDTVLIKDFSSCSNLNIKLNAKDYINQSEYEFLNCEKDIYGNKTETWHCDCYDGFELYLKTNPRTINSYNITMIYDYYEEVYIYQSSGGGSSYKRTTTTSSTTTSKKDFIWHTNAPETTTSTIIINEDQDYINENNLSDTVKDWYNTTTTTSSTTTTIKLSDVKPDYGNWKYLFYAIILVGFIGMFAQMYYEYKRQKKEKDENH